MQPPTDSQIVPVAAQRQSMPGEVWMHSMFLVLAVAVLLLSFLMRVHGTNLVYLPGSSLPLPESCSAKIFFGLDCPACGLTRAFISISHGKFGNAWNFNPASFIVYLFVALQLPWQSYQIFRINRGEGAVDQKWIYFLPILMAATLIIQWLARLLMFH